jgi:hypothetical protein
MAEIMPRDYEELHTNIMKMSIEFLCDPKSMISIKLVSTKCLIKFARKLRPEVLMSIIQG